MVTVAMANKLARVMWVVLRNQVPFNAQAVSA